MRTITGKLEIKPYTKKELAAIYRISPKSFATWLKPSILARLHSSNGNAFIEQFKIVGTENTRFCFELGQL